MVGVNPKFQMDDRASRAASPALSRRARPLRWHWAAMVALFAPLSLALVQCGRAPEPGMLAANTEGAHGKRDKAQQEFQLHDQIEKRQADAVERERRELKQFVVIQGQPATSMPQ